MPRHRMLLAGAIVAALLAHVLIFGGLGTSAPTRPGHTAAAVQVRVVDAPPAAEIAATPPEPQRPEPSPPAPRVQRPPRAPRVAAAPAPAQSIETVPATVPAVASNATAAALADTASADTDPTPIYPTALPPAFVLRYVLTRGALRGTAEFIWAPQRERYQLTLTGSVAGLVVLTQTSTGGFDAAGIAPQRFTDQRARRGTKAANFQRDAGKISFSGPSSEYTLRDGAQDRLSWMVQLGAIVAAGPQLREPGARIALYVVGASGDATVWTFDGLGTETVATPQGLVEALQFVREPRGPYDTQVQIWLDPAHAYMPVRATQKSGPNDDGYELRLQSGGPVP